VPITPFPARQAFDPEATRAMGIAFDNARKALGLADTTDGATEAVAMRVIELAQMGERDPEKIQAGVLATFNRTG
jgi:hypothetical protein